MTVGTNLVQFESQDNVLKMDHKMRDMMSIEVKFFVSDG